MAPAFLQVEITVYPHLVQSVFLFFFFFFSFSFFPFSSFSPNSSSMMEKLTFFDNDMVSHFHQVFFFNDYLNLNLY